MTARYHKRSAYVLLSPYVDRVAPFLISRIRNQPAALVETCSFMSTNVSAFISVTQSSTLPALFANRDRATIDAVAKELRTESYELFFTNASKILAHIFMLSKPGKTSAALSFIVDLLSSGTVHNDDGQIDPQSVVRGHVIDVITEIVLKMGEDDPSAVQLVSFVPELRMVHTDARH